DTLLAPIEAGGKKMFDLEARNEALHLLRLKSYLKINDDSRPLWCYVADVRLARHAKISDNIELESIMNMFLQSWAPNKSKLSPQLKAMISTARKYGVKFDTFNPSKAILEQLPMWHHF
ncbi:hypothetical protein C8F01DRAFT_938568, partial [Mycena amicta]